MGNPFCYAELNTGDPKGAKAFYGALFDWKLQDMVVGKRSTTVCHVGEGAPGGILYSTDGNPRWITFIQVDDLPTKLAQAQKLGGKVKQGATQVPGYGWYGLVIDPTGAEVGLWRSGETPA